MSDKQGHIIINPNHVIINGCYHRMSSTTDTTGTKDDASNIKIADDLNLFVPNVKVDQDATVHVGNLADKGVKELMEEKMAEGQRRIQELRDKRRELGK